jgi:hypothetical protein
MAHQIAVTPDSAVTAPPLQCGLIEQIPLLPRGRARRSAFRSAGIYYGGLSLTVAVCWWLKAEPLAALLAVFGTWGGLLLCGMEWAHYRQYEKQTRTVALKHDRLVVSTKMGETFAAPGQCRFFVGLCSHDPSWPLLDRYRECLIVSWPPHSRQSRSVCALDPDRRNLWTGTLAHFGAMWIPDRPMASLWRERAWGCGAGLAGLVGTLAVMSVLNLVTPIRDGHWFTCPFSSMIVSGWLGLTYARHRHGDVTTADGIGSWFKSLILFMAMGIFGRRRWNVIGIAGMTEWLVALAVLSMQIAACCWLFHRLRSAETNVQPWSDNR